MKAPAAALLLLAIVAILGVLAQLHGSITTDGFNVILASPDASGSLLFNNVNIFDEIAQMKVCPERDFACSHNLQSRLASSEASASRFEVWESGI